MKLSIDTSIISQRYGDKKAIELLKEAGFDAIDYSFYHLPDNHPMRRDDFRAYASQVRTCLDENGLICNQAHAPTAVKYGDKFDISEPHFAEIIHTMEAASILGAEQIIIHVVPISDFVNDKKIEEYNTDYYKSLVPYCEKFGIHVAVENLFKIDTKRNRYWGKLATPYLMQQLIKKINSPWIVSCIDIGHVAVTGSEPEDYIRGMDSDITKALHVHDNDYILDRHFLPFAGELNWNKIMAALKDINYSGDLTFEIGRQLNHFPDELIPDALKFAALVGRHLISLFNQ